MSTVSLRILCEGATELGFVTQVLAPHLRGFGVFAKAQLLPGSAGGVVSYERLKGAIQVDVGRSRSHEFVTTMIDLYALPKYPGDPKDRGVKGAERARVIEAAMAAELPSPQFVPYIQVHEFEALVFVDLEQLLPAFPDGEARGAPERLGRSIDDLEPEDIDDGPNTAPSKRLIREIPAYKVQKATVGPLIAVRIGLPRLRDACPHLDAWVRRLEGLAR